MDLSVFGGVGYWLITRGFWLEYFDLILLLRCYCHNPKQFGSWNTPPTGQSGEYSTSKIDWLVCLGWSSYFILSLASVWVTTDGTQTATQTTLMHRSIWKHICFASVWVTTDGTQTATQMTLMHRNIWKHICFASTWVITEGTQTATQTTLMHRSIWKRICFACIWVITEGIQTATQTTLTHRSIWKHICFSHYIRFYRGNSNRNSNPTQTHLIVKRTHFAVFELSETWDFIIFKRTSLKHPQSSKGRKKPCVSEF